MSITEHQQYPRKKRRLCLNNKTPNRITNKKSRSEQMIGTPTHIGALRSQLLCSPGIAGSSDESSLEIGWDNNSPSPTSLCSARSRRNNKQKASDIAKILKGVSRKKKHQTEAADKSINDNILSTWMQNDLAKVCGMEKKPTKYPDRRSSKRTCRKQGATNFNEELKRFMEQVMPSNKDLQDSYFQENRDCNMHGDILTSPNLFESTQNDSLLIVDNFDDLVLSELENSLDHGKSQSSLVLVKTPKLRRNLNLRSKSTPKRDNIFIKKLNPLQNKVYSDSLGNLAKNDTKSCISNQGASCKSNLKSVEQMSIDSSINQGSSINLDDDLEDMLIQEEIQPKVSNAKKYEIQPKVIKPKHDELPKHVINIISDDEEDKKDYFTKIKHKSPNENKQQKSNNDNKTKKIITTPKLKQQQKENLIDLDDDFMIDDIICNLDNEFKWKSQETPPQPVTNAAVSCEQRKLKKRCHTSPFPISRKKIIKSTGNSKVVDNIDNIDNGICVIDEEVSIKTNNRENKPNVYKKENTYLNTSRVTHACRRPFVPPFKSNTTNKTTASSSQLHLGMNLKCKNPLDLSVIGQPPVVIQEENDNQCISKATDAGIPYSSTQRCSMLEIERKRKEAQLRLKERLRKK